jgi:hypothetical protein
LVGFGSIENRCRRDDFCGAQKKLRGHNRLAPKVPIKHVSLNAQLGAQDVYAPDDVRCASESLGVEIGHDVCDIMPHL